MTLRPGHIVGYDRVPGGCSCRFELREARAEGAVWIAKCVATCFRCDFGLGFTYHLQTISIVFDQLSMALQERFGSC